MWGFTQHFASSITISPDAEWPPQDNFWDYGIFYLQDVSDSTKSSPTFLEHVEVLRRAASLLPQAPFTSPGSESHIDK